MVSVAADPASLQNLQDIVVPDPVAWWPPAPGWYGVGFLLLALGIWFLARRWRDWRRDAYRREALQMLADLRTADEGQGSPAVVAEVAALLRRTALCAYPRRRVVALTGEAWLEFLDATGGGAGFTEGEGRQLLTAAYRSTPDLGAIQIAEILRLAESWVRTHRPEAG